MRTPLAAMVVVAGVIASCSQSRQGPLILQSPPGWKVEHKRPNSLDAYFLTTKMPDEGLLMFTLWPPFSVPVDIPELVQKLAEARKSSGVALASEKYQVERFTGERCQGSYATFQDTTDGTKTMQVVFIMRVGGRLWSGQFHGRPDLWKQALRVLTSIKENG